MGLERCSPAKDTLSEGCEPLTKDDFRTTASSAHRCASHSGFRFSRGTLENRALIEGKARGRRLAGGVGGRGTLLGPRDAQLESASLTAPGLGGHGTFSLHKLGYDLDLPRPYGGRLAGLVQLE